MKMCITGIVEASEEDFNKLVGFLETDVKKEVEKASEGDEALIATFTNAVKYVKLLKEKSAAIKELEDSVSTDSKNDFPSP